MYRPCGKAVFDLERLAAQLARFGVPWLPDRLPAPSTAGPLEDIERFGTEVVHA
ncbi:MAG TPA: hypothetical protein VGN81_25035 [Pseudonocardiaceae bacterium]|jgi:hypothetical protein